ADGLTFTRSSSGTAPARSASCHRNDPEADGRWSLLALDASAVQLSHVFESPLSSLAPRERFEVVVPIRRGRTRGRHGKNDYDSGRVGLAQIRELFRDARVMGSSAPIRSLY